MKITTTIHLEHDEALLLHALTVYASAKIKPPVEYDAAERKEVTDVAESIVTMAPLEVMERLAYKLRGLTPAIMAREPVLAAWRRLQV